MPFTVASFDPETLAVLTKAFDAAWSEVQKAQAERAGDLATTRKLMALRMMDAANKGERDPERLKAIALRAVEGRDFG